MNQINLNTIKQELDTSGLWCPEPILRARQVLNQMQSGEVIKIISTDPSSVIDFQVFTRQTGNLMLNWKRDGNTWIYMLRKK